ncbi:MAG: cellulase family glycosylhydrolase, partial [Deltaproteobacteria bacterium]|nr:cellulase family glycosylhydrolase [Nannocystaceae bacterium]
MSAPSRLRCSGGALRDEHDRVCLLRGVNVSGRSKLPPFLPFEDPAPLDRLADWGMNAIRLLVIWEAIEPARGRIDHDYIARVRSIVAAAGERGLAVIVDFHQDIYASPFCGDGFPPWTIPGEPGPPLHNCSNWGLKYLTDGDVRAAFDRFWADEDDIQAKFFAMWDQMIDRIGDHPGVLGLEIVNEPGWGSRPVVAE